jgi:cytochrome c oxidase assembly protein subunit 15
MAGHRGAPAAPTWPDINGSFMPSYIFRQGLIGIIEDRIVIHFVHRTLAYLLVVMVIVWTVKAFKVHGSRLFAKTRALPLVFVLVQTILGILTVLTSVNIRVARWNEFEWMAQLHQFTALLLLLSLLLAAFLTQKQSYQ